MLKEKKGTKNKAIEEKGEERKLENIIFINPSLIDTIRY